MADITADRSALARQRLEAAIYELLPGLGYEEDRRIILGAVSDYTAAMIELCARPDDRWASERGEDGGAA